MAYGVWNQQVGQLCWKDIFNEKKDVYGKYIMCESIKNVIECGKCNIPLPKECQEYNWKFDLGISIVAIVIVIVVFLYVKYTRNNQEKLQKNEQISNELDIML